MAADVIQTFIEAYRREVDFYREASRACADKLDSLLEDQGVRAIVTYRAKRPDRLELKLRKRQKTKRYRTAEKIRADIVDFAGVRVALYFPGDQKKVDQIVRSNFVLLDEKRFPDTAAPKRSDTRFSGYHATHYRVQLPPNDHAPDKDRFGEAAIEIQVGSVLMHAWAEVEHDLGYKPLAGTLSLDENAILDELNGLVLAGEIALERLQRAVETRVSQEGARFGNRYELAGFIYDFLKEKHPGREDEPIIGNSEGLLELLHEADLDSSDKIAPYIDRAMNFKARLGPITNVISEIILGERPDLEGVYYRAQPVVGRTPNLPITLEQLHEPAKELVTSVDALISSLRQLGERRGLAPNSAIFVLEDLLEAKEIELHVARAALRVLRYRNRIMYGVTAGSLAGQMLHETSRAHRAILKLESAVKRRKGRSQPDGKAGPPVSPKAKTTLKRARRS